MIKLINPLPAWVTSAVREPAALDFIGIIFDVFEVWDDLVDRDKPVSDELISDAFRKAVVHLPINAFYMQNFGALYPHVVATITAWETANELHKAKDKESIAHAYTLRKLMINLIVECVRILDGNTAALNASVLGWSDSAKNDSFETFLGEAL
jgi:hypothetical protein